MIGKFSSHSRSKTLTGTPINHVQNPKRNSIMRSGLHEIIAPDMLGEEGFQPDHRVVIEPETSSFRLFLRDFQPLPAPDSLHAFVIDDPTFVSQQGGHPTVAVAAILAGQFDDPCGQVFFIIRRTLVLSLG